MAVASGGGSSTLELSLLRPIGGTFPVERVLVVVVVVVVVVI